ncbi:MAG: hypothetical protein PHR77_05190, partial [Kiritimatiellae bacterium]|nr:hypothetical protein [Kiritimatiellia bacterium]
GNQFKWFKEGTGFAPDSVKMGQYTLEVCHQRDRIFKDMVIDPLKDQAEQTFIAFKYQQERVIDVSISQSPGFYQSSGHLKITTDLFDIEFRGLHWGIDIVILS